jgi:hypothetical protein
MDPAMNHDNDTDCSQGGGNDVYALYAIRYAERPALRRDHFIGGDPHDAVRHALS